MKYLLNTGLLLEIGQEYCILYLKPVLDIYRIALLRNIQNICSLRK